MRLPLAAALGLLLALPAAAPAASPWMALPYFQFEPHTLFLATDTTWTGAKEVPTTQLTVVPSEWQRRGITRLALWAAKCRPGAAQTASFTKTFNAVGPADVATGNLQYAAATNSITKVEVFLNGVLVKSFGRGKGGDFAFGPAGRAAFRYGINLVKVRATRRKLPKHARCNAGPSSQANGVSLTIAGTFRTDLTYRDADSKTTYYKTSAGQVHRFTALLGTYNRGPGHALEGATSFVLSSGYEAALGDVLVTSVAPYATCTVTEKTHARNFEIFCPFSDWAPSETINEIQISFVAAMDTELASNFDDVAVRLDWTVAPGAVNGTTLGPSDADPNLHTALSNNTKSATWVLCGAKSTQEGCKTAQ